MPDISLVIPAYNEAKLCRDCSAPSMPRVIDTEAAAIRLK
jgi:hypothetical protein